MKAEILVKDGNESSCLITIYYTRFGFDSWTCGSKPIGPSTSGDCSRFGLTAIHLRDGNNILDMEFGLWLMPELMIEPGKTGKGWLKSSGFLQSGNVVWQIWNTRQTGAFGDKWMKEGAIN